MPNTSSLLVLICVIALIVLTTLIVIASRYRKCPSDKVMVIYGKVGSNADGTSRSAKCIHGGAAFIWPVIQSVEFLDLTPMSINVDLKNALSKQNIRVDVPSRFTVGISTEPGVMQNAAERMLGLKLDDIQELAKDIIFGQLRLVIATMEIEEINTDRDKFLEAVSRNVETELKKIGLRLINVNVTDITEIARAVEGAGADALSLINTLRGMRIDVNTGRPVLKMNTGGLSGPAVLPVAVRMVWEVAQAGDLPILGMGGVSKGEDAAQMMLAGASAVAVGTALFADPFAPIRVRDGLEAIAERKELDRVSGLTGGVKVW